jgi:co-chaperonin GroES (HSP10)|tara:strand:- start:500 stop:910 length:411 start_codon:yes stop_codon:yes gene_type:complete
MNDMAHLHEDKDWGNDPKTDNPKHLPKPTGWRVLVKPQVPMTKTSGGLYLPEQSRDNEEYLTAHGVILDHGPLAWCERESGRQWHYGRWANIGDHVTFGKYAGQKLVIDGVKLLLLNDDEITSVVPEGCNIQNYIP